MGICRPTSINTPYGVQLIIIDSHCARMTSSCGHGSLCVPAIGHNNLVQEFKGLKV